MNRMSVVALIFDPCAVSGFCLAKCHRKTKWWSRPNSESGLENHVHSVTESPCNDGCSLGLKYEDVRPILNLRDILAGEK